MSHDRGCFCGREKYEYQDCDREDCTNKERIMVKTPAELDDFDFGFSAVDENELDSIKELEAKAQTLAEKAAQNEQLGAMVNEKLKKMYNMIVPLLDNLAKDPDKSYIYWPDRQKKIAAFKQKLREVIE